MTPSVFISGCHRDAFRGPTIPSFLTLTVCLSSTAVLDLASSSPGCWWGWSPPSSWLEETWRNLFVILSTPKNSLRQVHGEMAQPQKSTSHPLFGLMAELLFPPFLFAAPLSSSFYSLSDRFPVTCTDHTFSVCLCGSPGCGHPLSCQPRVEELHPRLHVQWLWPGADSRELLQARRTHFYVFRWPYLVWHLSEAKLLWLLFFPQPTSVLSVFLHLHLVTKLKGFLSQTRYLFNYRLKNSCLIQFSYLVYFVPACCVYRRGCKCEGESCY